MNPQILASSLAEQKIGFRAHIQTSNSGVYKKVLVIDGYTVLVIKGSMTKRIIVMPKDDFLGAVCMDHRPVGYSLWSGYLDNENGDPTRKMRSLIKSGKITPMQEYDRQAGQTRGTVDWRDTRGTVIESSLVSWNTPTFGRSSFCYDNWEGTAHPSARSTAGSNTTATTNLSAGQAGVVYLDGVAVTFSGTVVGAGIQSKDNGDGTFTRYLLAVLWDSGNQLRIGYRLASGGSITYTAYTNIATIMQAKLTAEGVYSGSVGVYLGASYPLQNQDNSYTGTLGALNTLYTYLNSSGTAAAGIIPAYDGAYAGLMALDIDLTDFTNPVYSVKMLGREVKSEDNRVDAGGGAPIIFNYHRVLKLIVARDFKGDTLRELYMKFDSQYHINSYAPLGHPAGYDFYGTMYLDTKTTNTLSAPGGTWRVNPSYSGYASLTGITGQQLTDSGFTINGPTATTNSLILVEGGSESVLWTFADPLQAAGAGLGKAHVDHTWTAATGPVPYQTFTGGTWVDSGTWTMYTSQVETLYEQRGSGVYGSKNTYYDVPRLLAADLRLATPAAIMYSMCTPTCAREKLYDDDKHYTKTITSGPGGGTTWSYGMSMNSYGFYTYATTIIMVSDGGSRQVYCGLDQSRFTVSSASTAGSVNPGGSFGFDPVWGRDDNIGNPYCFKGAGTGTTNSGTYDVPYFGTGFIQLTNNKRRSSSLPVTSEFGLLRGTLARGKSKTVLFSYSIGQGLYSPYISSPPGAAGGTPISGVYLGSTDISAELRSSTLDKMTAYYNGLGGSAHASRSGDIITYYKSNGSGPFTIDLTGKALWVDDPIAAN